MDLLLCRDRCMSLGPSSGDGSRIRKIPSEYAVSATRLQLDRVAPGAPRARSRPAHDERRRHARPRRLARLAARGAPPVAAAAPQGRRSRVHGHAIDLSPCSDCSAATPQRPQRRRAGDRRRAALPERLTAPARHQGDRRRHAQGLRPAGAPPGRVRPALSADGASPPGASARSTTSRRPRPQPRPPALGPGAPCRDHIRGSIFDPRTALREGGTSYRAGARLPAPRESGASRQQPAEVHVSAFLALPGSMPGARSDA